MPFREPVPVELHLVRGGPPGLVIGGGNDLPQLVAGDCAAQGDAHVRGEAPLGFDGGEVLEVVAEEAAQVLEA